jgi:hypothetical protein
MPSTSITHHEESGMRQTLLLTFQPQGTPPAGQPPSFDVKSGPGSVRLLDGDGSAVPTQASYETHVVLTGEMSFTEEGNLTFEDGGLRLTSVGEGVIEPSAEEGVLRGAVIWRVEGTGGWSGATGLLTSNFLFRPDNGTAEEQVVARIVRP